MRTIPFVRWIAHAAACLTGPHGAVTDQAKQSGCSRQCAYNHTQKVLAAVAGEHSGGPTRQELLRENEALRRENAQLWNWLFQTIEFPASKQFEFCVTAAAMGLSLHQILVLLAVILGQQACPGRSTLPRWIQHAAETASRVLKGLDAQCKALILVGCLDEIFFPGRPILVGVEPASMVWFLGQKAPDRSGATWAKSLRGWSALAFVTADAGTGLHAGIATVQQERHDQGQPALENGLDVFHTTSEARPVLRLNWQRVERLWEQAEQARRRVQQQQRQGQDSRGAALAARHAWKQVEAALAQ